MTIVSIPVDIYLSDEEVNDILSSRGLSLITLDLYDDGPLSYHGSGKHIKNEVVPIKVRVVVQSSELTEDYPDIPKNLLAFLQSNEYSYREFSYHKGDMILDRFMSHLFFHGYKSMLIDGVKDQSTTITAD